MKTVLKRISQAALLLPLMVLSFAFVAPVGNVLAQEEEVGATGCDDLSGGVKAGAECVAPSNAGARQNLFGDGGIFVTVVNILLFIIGAIAVIMLIVGGIRYVLSQGDQSSITSAKNTILYAIIGIVVAMLAYGAVQFITTQLQQV